VLPVLELGGQGIHIPHGVTWEYEADHNGNPDTHGYHVLTAFSELPEFVAKLQVND
jgi:putative hydrolase of the HAD superfamily